MKTTLHVERRVTANADQYLKFTVPSDVWIAALAEHGGDVKEAFDSLNFEGDLELELAKDVVSQTLDIHETTVEVGEPNEE